MPTYNAVQSRAAVVDAAAADPLIPTPVSDQIIQELPHNSVVLARAKRIGMSTQTFRMPVLAALPDAFFVTGDTGLKETTTADWDNVIMTAEELAAIVVVPDAYISDAQVPIWDEIRPWLVQRIGRAIDRAALFGVNKPSTWSTDIYTAATAAGNTVTVGANSSPDLAVDVAKMGLQLSKDGYAINGFASAPGFVWNLNTMRSSQGVPIYQPNLQGQIGGSLYGYPLNEVLNGAWDPTKASLIGGDWDKAIVGIRQDITFEWFREGVTSNASGVVQTNLMQQDSRALRVVMRLGFVTANPITELNATAGTRYPFSVLSPVAALS